jgi:hypothetical protein
VVTLASGEWFLETRANGGTVILARAALVASWLYIVAIAVHSRLAPNATWAFSPAALAAEMRETLQWLGTLFAGAYIALYTRFSAQWSYLAEFYNQIMVTQIQTPPEAKTEEGYAKWFVAFIADAETLHLVYKPTFASVVRSLLSKPRVEEFYVDGSVEAARDLKTLKEGLAKVLGPEVAAVGPAI